MSAPSWTRHPTVVWVVDDAALRCEDVGDAHLVSTAYADAASQAASLPHRMRELRARGATVKTAAEATDAVKTSARRLRGALAAVSPRRLAAVAHDLELPVLAAALETWPTTLPITFENLASACTEASAANGKLTRSARLLLALEHL